MTFFFCFSISWGGGRPLGPPLDTRLEINYKIINKAYLSKWICETNAKCYFCNQNEDTIHLLYDCSFNDHIWHIVGNCLQLNFTYKHVLLGYSSKIKNVNVNSINYCITLICTLFINTGLNC